MGQKKIFQYFEGNAELHVLFIFDPMGGITADLAEATWPDGYRMVEFKGDWFTVKYNLANAWKDDKVILIFHDQQAPNYQDDKMDFPLYGEMKANMVYSEENYLTFMQLKGIKGDFAPYIASHVAELQLSKFEKIMEPYYQPGMFSIDVCNRGLLSGYLGQSRLLGWDEIIIRLVCLDGSKEKDKISAFFRALKNNQDGGKALEEAMTGICGVSYDSMAENRMGRFIESFKYNSIVQNLTATHADDYKSYKINSSVVLQRLNSFRETAYNHATLAEQFSKAVNYLGVNIQESKIISWYGPDADYGFVTEALSWPVIESIIKGKAISNPVESNEKLRAFSLRLPADAPAQEVIDFLSNCCFLLEKIGSLGSFTYKTPKDYITKYITDFYLVDSYYRQCVGEFRDIATTVPVYDSLMSFKKHIDSEYAKTVNLFNLEWIRCIKDTGIKPLELDGILHQQDFYEKKLKGVDAKRVIIISDALRYEVGVEILNGMGDAKHEVSIEPALAILPTETKYSKLTLLPHSELKYTNCNLEVDGEVLDSIDKRTAQVKRFEKDALCISFEDLSNYSMNQKREIFKNKLVYIFHDTIDSLSHDNPSKLSIACKTAVEEIKKLVPSLHATYNVANVYVTSDHGFLFNDIPFEEKDKQKVDDNYEERKTRYYITEASGDVFGVSKYPMSDVSTMKNSGKIVAVPGGSNRFYAEGGGYQFAHGGATLQEMIIPVLYSHLRREDTKKSVDVTLLRSSMDMISSRLKFQIIQSHAVSEDYKERRILCGIYEGTKLLTAEKEVLLNSTDANPQNRFTTVDLTLTTPSSGGLLELRIYDAEDKDKLNPLAKATVINKTLIDQDF